MKAISSTQYSQVISLLQNKYSCRYIAAKTGLGKSTVHEISKALNVDKENQVGGYPHKLSTCDQHIIIRQITTGKLDNAVQAAKFINPTLSNPVNPQTIRNMLRKNNLHSKVKTKHPLLKQKHRNDRLNFALVHKDWSVNDWKRVLWTDETKINRIGSDGRVYTWEERGKALSDRTTIPTVKHGGGGNIMVWGCMGWNGVGKLVEVQGKMDADQYCDILDDGVMESFEKLEIEEEERIFQQDNDPKHTSKKGQNWFKDCNVQVLLWPAQSPDLNPIEHLQVHLKNQLNGYESPPKRVFELWARLEVEWDKISPEVCQRLIESMPRWLEAVIKAKGGHTKY